MQCGSCGADNPLAARFCSACGSPRAVVSCPSCGHALLDDAKFCGGCGALVSAERRQLTIAFVDLVGSTALASRLDPEELQDIVRAYQVAVAAVVERYRGHVAQYLGDGLLLYFGYPHAHENTAESAVRAGLEIVRAVRTLVLPQDVTFRVRVGIATGLVVVGEPVAGVLHSCLYLLIHRYPYWSGGCFRAGVVGYRQPA